jgi:hypothetical protein
MDQTRAREIAKDAAEQASKTVNQATQRVGEQVQPALDQAKATAQDLGNRASEAGRQAMDRAGEFAESVAPQAKQVASNLYDQGSQSVAQEPLVAMCRLDRVHARLSDPRTLRPTRSCLLPRPAQTVRL